MPHWLASERTCQPATWLTRFDPTYWTVNFPRPAIAAVTTTAPDAPSTGSGQGLRVDAVFYNADELVGLIWEAEDRFDHPLLRYETARDFRRCTLSFRWRSAGVLPLDAVNGPVLTIEGRDAGGVARSWYVRLWNYAAGSPENAAVTIDFADVDGGFLLPGEANPVFAGDVDRMFVSLAPVGYTGVATPLPSAQEAWVELSEIACTGSGSVLAIGDVVVPEHSLSIASGYDDSYNLTPARLLHQALRLGYRGAILHYLGMSHLFRLSGGLATTIGGALNVAAAAWHRDFASRARALGYEVIWSLSYELLDRHCPDAWKQRDAAGEPALTGWVPPSTLLSPANAGAMAYLQAAAAAVLAIGAEAGLAPRFQIGEPWWWVKADGAPCLYDAAATAALGSAAVALPSVRGGLSTAQTAMLDAAGAILAQSTAALAAAAKAAAPGCEVLLLTYLPGVLDPAAPELRRANLPVGWAAPSFDALQLEDYDWVVAGNRALSAAARGEMAARLGYLPGATDYLSGFVLRPEDAADWAAIDAAAVAALPDSRRVFLWALPQVLRDGFVHFEIGGDDDMQAFDDMLFPLALGREAEVAPEFSTAVIVSAGGHERRSVGWAEARTRYDVGPGVRSEADVAALLAFFRARLGPARGFRLRDPFDWSSGGSVPTPLDQLLGQGDGARSGFGLVKHYGDTSRRITRPVAGSVRVAVDGVETVAFSLGEGGVVMLDVAPVDGMAVTAGFLFDVPVRFAEDRLTVQRATFQAGSAANVPLVEVREA